MEAKFSKLTGGVYPTNAYAEFPSDAVEIPGELYARFKAGEIHGFDIQDGKVVEFVSAPLSHDQLKANQLMQIKIDSNSAIIAITDSYPPGEVLSWPKQEAEARAYVSGSLTTPLIDALADARNVDKDYLVQKIIEKADQFAVISGTLIGKRQKLEDQLNALPPDASPESIAAIKWE